MRIPKIIKNFSDLNYFRAKQLHIIDGEEMRSSPVAVLNRLQHFLEIPFYDYKDKLVFDEKKGFYCQVLEGKKKVNKKSKNIFRSFS